MKVAIIDTKPAPFRVPIYNMLAKKGIDIVMTSKSTRPGFKTSKLPYTFLKSIKFPFFSPGYCPGLWNHLKKKDYDILIACDLAGNHTWITYLYCLAHNKKFIIWNEQWGEWSKAFKAQLAYPLVKHIIRNADALIATGTLAKKWLIKEGAKEKIFVSLNCAEDLLPRVNKKKVKQIKDKYKLHNKIVFLRVSRLVKYKALEVMINAFNTLPKNCKLLIVGGPEKRKAYKTPLSYAKEIKKLASDRIVFVGEIPYKDIPNYFGACNVFLHTPKFLPKTLNNNESWGMVVNEAMSVGKPIIVSDSVGSGGDCVDKSNGFIVKSNSKESLEKAMKTIIKKNLKSMGKKSREKIEKIFTYKNMAEGYFQAIDYILKKLKPSIWDCRRYVIKKINRT